jgi:hypothetical protein
MPPSAEPTFDPNAIGTYVVQTAQSALTLSAVPLLMQTVTPSLTLTPTETETPTPAYTFTPAVPLIRVSTDTNCRSGPGKVYDYNGALLTGQSAEIFGRDTTGKYLYIRNPDDPNRYCWVWNEYATFSGNIAFLPIFTPPPTPTATNTPSPTPTPIPASDFQVSYTSMDSCAGWWLEFKITNIGLVNLKSVQVDVLDKSAGKTVSNLTDGFTDINGCLTSKTKDMLAPGASAIISSAAFPFKLTGHQINAKITVCSKYGLNGSCIVKKIKITP